MLSSKASEKNAHGQNSSYFLGWEEYERNPYDPVSNPQGMIQMGLAENQLCFDLLESWMENNPDATGFKSNDGQNMFRELALFQDYNGLPRFKKAMSEFMGKIRGNRVKFNPDNLVLTAGATSANEILMFCLADPGDAFLVPTPYYPGFDRDLKWRTGAEIVPIKCTSNNGFRITKSALEESMLSAQKNGLRVKGILVTNPSNPLGTTLTLSEITLLLTFISTHSLHLIADEIYAGTTTTPNNSTFTSFISDHDNSDNDSLRWGWDELISKRVHLVTSLSKDMGLPGFRIGAIYTLNMDVHSAATKMSSFGLMSSATQHLMAVMLSDREFMRLYVEENRIRLRRRREILVKGLERVGVGCLESDAGLFCWVDMRGLLLAMVTCGGGMTSLEDAEVELWRKFIYEVRINVSPGGSCHCAEPGWFRFCFANLDEETLRLAVRRIQGFVMKLSRKRSGGRLLNGLRGSGCRRQQSLPTSLTKWVSRLSFDDRDPDDR